MAFTLQLDQWIYLICFGILYLGFLGYDLFKRGEKYGYIAYFIALLPANYLWYCVTLPLPGHYYGQDSYFGAMGSMALLAVLWIACVLRDILIKNKQKHFKDADDIALMLIIGLVIQFILSAVLPTTPGLQTMQQGTSQFLSYFYVPNFSAASSNPTSQIIILWYKLFATVLTVAMIYATVMDLKGEKVSLIAVIIITVIFGLPFAFLAYLWLPLAFLPILILIMVVFFLGLLAMTRGVPT